MQLFVVQSQIDQGRALFAYEVFDFRVIVSFVFTAEDKYGFAGHALQGIPAGVYVRSLGIVDEAHAAYGGYFLQPVFHSLEVGQGFADIFFPDAGQIGRDAGG